MSDRAGLTFTAGVQDEQAKKQLVELQRLGDNVNLHLQAVDAQALRTATHAMKVSHDALFLFQQVSEVLGLQWSATQQLALTLVEQAFLAGRHALAMIEASAPWMLPWVLTAYATIMTMQVLAYQEVQEKGQRASDDYYRAQLAMQMVMRFSGV